MCNSLLHPLPTSILALWSSEPTRVFPRRSRLSHAPDVIAAVNATPHTIGPKGERNEQPVEEFGSIGALLMRTRFLSIQLAA